MARLHLFVSRWNADVLQRLQLLHTSDCRRSALSSLCLHGLWAIDDHDEKYHADSGQIFRYCQVYSDGPASYSVTDFYDLDQLENTI
ncbi:hypothetical protein RvY_17881-2 [Ramazzottius varieornatus]|uniref:Uncharacterized protein n=1 Tax=Ramazzottius varieornatus TaxID=947166 RepID=A0A1D1W7D5_RAMVA|nr:hypothetical protein RvY_17881-2 [Ramazzottius varieornatus]